MLVITAIASGCKDPQAAHQAEFVGMLTQYRASQFYDAGKYHDCLKILQDDILTDPTNSEAYLLSGDAYTRLGRIQDANAQYRKAIAAAKVSHEKRGAKFNVLAAEIRLEFNEQGRNWKDNEILPEIKKRLKERSVRGGDGSSQSSDIESSDGQTSSTISAAGT
ncbi:MAG: hypothetical protein ABI579_08840 [Candidatus Sumerlaeota bacterium]